MPEFAVILAPSGRDPLDKPRIRCKDCGETTSSGPRVDSKWRFDRKRRSAEHDASPADDAAAEDASSVLEFTRAAFTHRQDIMSEINSPRHIMELTAQIVSAHVAHNSVPPAALMNLIQTVYTTLSEAGREPVATAAPQPAVPIKKSVFPDYIVCLEDGKQLKMLKRHLHTSFNMTPEQYRARWGLPHDYPMVAPNYAAHRSDLAKKIGLGSSRKVVVTEPESSARPRKPARGAARKAKSELAETA